MRVQLRYGRQQARDKAKNILNDSVINLTKQFKQEINSVIDSFQYYKGELRIQDKKLTQCRQAMQEQELMIVQLNQYIQTAGINISRNKEEIKHIKNETKANLRKGTLKKSEIMMQGLSTMPELNFYSFYLSTSLHEDRN